MNTGHKGQQHDIFAYNGGLFAPDEILDNIKINDDLLYKHTINLSNYDFESEVSVNILGHIFEHSLNDIDEIQNAISNNFNELKSVGKRKKDGVFYTPKYITKYIVDNTVGKLCEEKKTALDIQEAEYEKERKGRQKATLKKLSKKLEDYRKWLLQITICDPACGSGAFLNQALEFLIAEHQYIDELQAKLFGDAMVLSEVENAILENNLFGVDINEESVEIAKLSLWLRTAQKGRKLTALNNNIKCGNSLIDDPTVAGDKAFNWQKEFPEVFKEKNKKAYHITTAIHDSRTSARMIKYKVRELREGGTNPFPNVIYFTKEDDLLITQTIADIVKEDNLNLLAYNICADHIHLLLVCDIDEIPAIMQKIKGRTSYTRGLSPLAKGGNKKPLWSQKYSAPKEITSQEQLGNTIGYIQTNRNKHELPPHSNEVQILIDQMCCSVEQAFTPEYKGGFDVVIGNPPYVDNRGFDKDVLQYLFNKFQNSFKKSGTDKFKTTKLNLIAPFIEINSNILKHNGYLSYIFHKNIFKTNGYTAIRKFILKNFYIELLTDWGAGQFQDVIAETATFTLKKNKESNENIKVEFYNLYVKKFENTQAQKVFLNAYEHIFGIYSSKEDRKILKKIEKADLRLKELVNINNGIVTGNDKKYLHHSKINEDYKKALRGRDIARYGHLKTNEYIYYKKEELLRARDEEIFNNTEKLIMQMINIDFVITYDNNQYYNLGTTYAITLKKAENLLQILGVLNSKLIGYYYRKKYTNDSTLTNAISTKNLYTLPIVLGKDGNFVKLVNDILEQNKVLSDISGNKLKLIVSKFNIQKPSKKLQNWYELDFGEFIKELEKARKKSAKETTTDLSPLGQYKKLSLSEQAEWMQYFNEQKQKVVQLKTKIEKTDHDIDQMVYELYGLTDAEIAIVEEATK